MKNILKTLLINPLLVYAKRLSETLYYEFIYRKQHLSIGSMSHIYKCKFGLFNTIGDYATMRTTNLGSFTYISGHCSINNTRIGKFCSIGPNVKCGPGIHPSRDFMSTHPIFFSSQRQSQITFVNMSYFKESKLITIGNDVWVGANAIILDGTSIGDGAIIGAGAVVTKDVPPYAIFGGVPARLIRFRFTEDKIKKLLKFKWWDKDVKWIEMNYKKFYNINSIDTIIKSYSKQVGQKKERSR